MKCHKGHLNILKFFWNIWTSESVDPRLVYSNITQYSKQGPNRMKCQSSSGDCSIFEHFKVFSLRRGDLIRRSCSSVGLSVTLSIGLSSILWFFKKRGFKSKIATCPIQPNLYSLIHFLNNGCRIHLAEDSELILKYLDIGVCHREGLTLYQNKVFSFQT